MFLQFLGLAALRSSAAITVLVRPPYCLMASRESGAPNDKSRREPKTLEQFPRKFPGQHVTGTHARFILGSAIATYFFISFYQIA